MIALRPVFRNVGAKAVELECVPLFAASLPLEGGRQTVFKRCKAFDKVNAWYGSPFWDAGKWARIGRNWQHPADAQPTVRAFQCPENGEVTVAGRVFKLHRSGDGVAAAIRHNMELVWSAELEGSDGGGVEPQLDLTVAEGDVIRFIVSKRGTISCDTTGWDPTVTYAGGRRFRASESFSGEQGGGGWFYDVQTGDPDAVYYPQLSYKTGKWYDSTFWQGGHVWCRVGKNWHHPGEAIPSVRRFTAPRAGKLTISGRVYALHKGGDGTDVAIRHNGTEVWKQFIGGSDDKGVDPELELTVRKGDCLRFVVSQHGSITCDTTHWDPIVRYATGESFQASQGFSGKQGSKGWGYEMYQPDPPAPPLPPVRQLGSNLMIRRAAAAAGQRQGLPLFVLAGPDDQSGIALAADASRDCELRTTPSDDHCELRLELLRHGRITVPPGGEAVLPAVAVSAYSGRWIAGFTSLVAGLPKEDGEHALGVLGQAVAKAFSGLGRVADVPELDLFLLAQAEWLREDGIDGSAEPLRAAITEHLTRTEALVCEVRSGAPGWRGDVLNGRLRSLAAQNADPDLPRAQLESVYLRTRLLKRDVVFSHPLLDFDQLLFGKRRLCRWSHLVMQYYGFRARRGGGIFVLEEPGRSTRTRSVVGDQLPPGNFLEPRLSYDGKRVVFSYVECGDAEIDYRTLVQNEEGEDVGYYHVYEIGVDGTGLRQLTSGPYDDVMPNYLPDGGIVFCSSRRKGYSRCFGGTYSKRWHTYTVHRLDADGSGIRILSHNDVSEWFPVVGNTGHVLFARWDYIDRHAVWHQNLWAMRPDGTNQMALWGNGSSKPHCTFQIQPVPGSSKIAFIPSAHHALTGGPVCLVDPNVDANSQAAITRITPQPFPEAEGFKLPDYYEFVWPLSERLFLVGYSDQDLRSQGRSYEDPTPDNALGLYVLDAAGNRELVYRDPALNSSTPMPLRPRPRPPVLTSTAAGADSEGAEFAIADIERGLGDIPKGTIKQLRVVQIFPKTTPWANSPRIGFAGEENARAVLGTVSVEVDGSARFLVPAGKLVLFQALDGNGDAYQVMRSTTVLQPGERTACIGCHESRMNAPPGKPPLAMRKPPRPLTPGPFDGKPFNYMTVVQPIWDKHCVSCHGAKKPKKAINLTGTPRAGFAESYHSLCGAPNAFDGGKTNPENAREALVPRFGQRNRIDITEPGGVYGARGSRLMKMLRKGHGKTKLSDDELRRVAMWIDQNAIFYGAYLDKRRERQLAGKDISMPAIQ